jgi:hypothetical protein
VGAEQTCGLFHRVVAMDLGPARIAAPALHGSAVQLLDEGADILDLPGRGARPELYRLGKAAGLYASPPSRAAYGNRPIWRED